MRPDQSYLICATPRSGSYLLCEALTNSGVAGKPAEYFWRGHEPYWTARWGTHNYREYLHAALEEASTENGVFGAKIMWEYMSDFREKLESLHGPIRLPDLLSETFPRLRYVRITRRDKLAQAVSRSKALQTGRWFDKGDKPPATSPRFDFRSVEGLLARAREEEAAWDAFFQEADVQPLTIEYEDLVDSYQVTTALVLCYLGIEPPARIEGARHLRRQADATSGEWIELYRALELKGTSGLSPSVDPHPQLP
ncbi:MAG: Stf0 family sulfotransferase [Chloroflexota bacterium]